MCWLRLQLFVAAHHNMKVQGSRQNQEEGRLIKKEKVDNKRNRESEQQEEYIERTTRKIEKMNKKQDRQGTKTREVFKQPIANEEKRERNSKNNDGRKRENMRCKEDRGLGRMNLAKANKPSIN